MGGLYETLSGAKGARADAKNAQVMMEYQAKVAEQEAAAARQKAKFDSIQQAKKAERIQSALENKIAGAGGAGSPVAVDLAAEQAELLELENLLIGYEGEVTAKRAESQAALDRLQGQVYKARGKTSARAANVGFGMQLASLGLTGFKAKD